MNGLSRVLQPDCFLDFKLISSLIRGKPDAVPTADGVQQLGLVKLFRLHFMSRSSRWVLCPWPLCSRCTHTCDLCISCVCRLGKEPEGVCCIYSLIVSTDEVSISKSRDGDPNMGSDASLLRVFTVLRPEQLAHVIRDGWTSMPDTLLFSTNPGTKSIQYCTRIL